MSILCCMDLSIPETNWKGLRMVDTDIPFRHISHFNQHDSCCHSWAMPSAPSQGPAISCKPPVDFWSGHILWNSLCLSHLVTYSSRLFRHLNLEPTALGNSKGQLRALMAKQKTIKLPVVRPSQCNQPSTPKRCLHTQTSPPNLGLHSWCNMKARADKGPMNIP